MSPIWQIHFYWGNGSHAQDLKAKKILLAEETTDVGESTRTPCALKNVVLAIPINTTKRHLDLLLQVPNIDIVSLAGLMLPTMPEYEEGKIATLHALWWPDSTENLRLVRASDGWANLLSELVIQRSREQWIQIIERTREEHDTQMAYHQALTHAAIILHDSVKTGEKILPKTSPEVIADMLHMNPYFWEAWSRFVEYLEQWKSLGKAYSLCMNIADPELATQNSQRQLGNSQNWDIRVDEKFLEKLSDAFTWKNRIQTIHLINQSRQ